LTGSRLAFGRLTGWLDNAWFYFVFFSPRTICWPSQDHLGIYIPREDVWISGGQECLFTAAPASYVA